MRSNLWRTLIVFIALIGFGLFRAVRYVESAPSPAQTANTFEETVQPFFSHHCYVCHNAQLETGGLNLEAYKTAASIVGDRPTMELILKKLSAGAMPPPKMPRPTPGDVKAVTEWLARQLAAGKGRPAKLQGAGRPAEVNPGRVTARRLNRTEYNNTVRDLLGVDLHPADDFPQDDSGYGFDNIGDVLSLSPVLMEKYLAAAEKVARAAVFGPEPLKPNLVRLRPPERAMVPQLSPLTDYDLTGLSLPNAVHNSYRFPVDGEYVIRANLGGVRPAGSEAIRIALWIDGLQVQVARSDPAAVASFAENGDRQELGGMTQEFRTKITAGDHWVAVSIPRLYEGLPPSYNGPNPSTRPIPPLPQFKAFPGLSAKELEDRKKEFDKRRAEKIPANGARIRSLDIGGPYAEAKGPSPESSKKIYVCGRVDRPACVRQIVKHLAHRAYRRPVTRQEVNQLAGLISAARKEGRSFGEGLCVAIEAMLLSPHFLYRIERDPAAPSTHPISQHELASRLSYFLWSSMPDDALLAAADRGQLAKPGVLESQLRRMLLDPKSRALAENFGGQWLEVRKLETVKPDRKRFPEFDDYLRRSMRLETEMFFESIMREDHSILDFIDANYTYLNERLARFYNVPGVRGPQFRKVMLAADTHRGGILTQASVLTVSSYATRTSPVLRGKWVLANLLGSPPPPPPPDVPNLEEARIGTAASLREQLEQHRKNPTCASCHARMDPLGFGLENFDAVGAWRARDGQSPINASGTLPDGRSFEGLPGLESILQSEPDAFAECLTRKLLTYALGRGLEPYDTPAVKKIVAAAAANNYRFSSLVLGIVESAPFRMRRGENPR